MNLSRKLTFKNKHKPANRDNSDWKDAFTTRTQCCGSGMFIPDPGSWFLPIPDPGSRIQKQQQKREVKKNFCHTFLCSHKFHKIVNYFNFEVLKKKIWANFQRNIELFTKKIVKKLLKIWYWDPGSEIRDPEKTYSGSRIQGSKRHQSRIPDPDPQHCPYAYSKILNMAGTVPTEPCRLEQLL